MVGLGVCIWVFQGPLGSCCLVRHLPPPPPINQPTNQSPNQAAAFFFQPIKKTSGWGKRLWRVTQIWVSEYKDWPAFAKTASAMFVNHAKRQLASYGIGGGA